MGAVFSRAAPRPHPLAWISDTPPRWGYTLGLLVEKGRLLLFTFLCGLSKKSDSPTAKAFDLKE
jgi:hypothetical protein